MNERAVAGICRFQNRQNEKCGADDHRDPARKWKRCGQQIRPPRSAYGRMGCCCHAPDKPRSRNDQANKAIQAAGILCQSKQFGRYLKEQVGLPEVDPDVPSTIEDGLRAMLGVKSRTELHTNADAIKAFYQRENTNHGQ